ncbi:DUF262 domain-containing protein [Prochlorothrix hollandica]|uniref:DUF262 domain-containing protein n=1 Tax=Prochlorothrix hollandica TaxID=1223 RepID=UPI003340CDCA
MGLQEELEQKRKEIRTDSYSMSVGELISLYENEEIEIHPQFQRFFRWSATQKTRLIESLLIGLPIPQIFVSQRDNGIWDVVDGLQRLSTIYEFVGILRDEMGRRKPPFVLEQGETLPSLKGKKWDSSDDPENSLTQVERLLIKRSKLEMAILIQGSDPSAKYELFQRLNTGGSIATDQEIRNCLLIMADPDLYENLKAWSDDQNFKECISLSDKAQSEQYDLELILRFLVFRNMEIRDLQQIPYPDISDYLTYAIRAEAIKNKINYQQEKEAFETTFSLLADSLGDRSFRKYSHAKEKFTGGFLVSAFEAIALGIGYNYQQLQTQPINLEETVKALWQNPGFTDSLGGSTKGSISTRKRVQTILPLGRELFES